MCCARVCFLEGAFSLFEGVYAVRVYAFGVEEKMGEIFSPPILTMTLNSIRIDLGWK